MKKLLPIFLLAQSAFAGTPFYFSGQNADGSPQTNPVTVRAFPPNINGFTVYGTNIIWGAGYFTNTPNASGFFSNSLLPNMYQFSVPALGQNFYANIPDTTNYYSLATYLTNANVVGTIFPGYVANSYSGVTNALTFAPATNSAGGIIFALGFTPPTNNYAGITNALKYLPATNGAALAYSLLPFTPPTNTFVGLTNVLGFGPATNNPAVNTIVYVSAVSGITNASGYVTNLTVTLATNTINYQQR